MGKKSFKGKERTKDPEESLRLFLPSASTLRCLCLIWDYSTFSTTVAAWNQQRLHFLDTSSSHRSFSSFSLMRWNVAKLATERQSVIYTAIKWSFTKHTQYALDGGFVIWDGLLMHSNGGGCWDVARRWKMPNWGHPSLRNKKACSALSGWEEWDICVGPLSFSVREGTCKWICKRDQKKQLCFIRGIASLHHIINTKNAPLISSPNS